MGSSHRRGINGEAKRLEESEGITGEDPKPTCFCSVLAVSLMTPEWRASLKLLSRRLAACVPPAHPPRRNLKKYKLAYIGLAE